MHINHRRPVVFGLLILGASCATAPTDLSSSLLWQEIKVANEALEERMRQNDLAGVAALYADDAVLLGPNGFRVAFPPGTVMR